MTIDRLLSLRRGESTRAIALFSYLFLVVTSYVVTKSSRDAMFLGRYSATLLPYADIASALAVAAVMPVYIRLGRRFGLRLVLTGTLVTFACTSLIFWMLSRGAEPSWMLPALYVWASIFGVLLPAQVWTLANYVLTTREAKRLYGVIGSGAISGWIVGGFITRATAKMLGTSTLLLLTALALGVCPLLVMAVWRERRLEGPDRSGSWTALRPDTPRGFKDSMRMVWSSPYLRAIASVTCLSSLVTTVAAWQFRAIAKTYFTETDALTAFFGTFNIYAGLLSLGTQLFLTSRLLRHFGLGTALLIVPLALTAGSFGVLVWGGIGAAVMLKGSDQVLRYSIDRSTVELLYLPVPARQTFHAKSFIDTVVWRLGDCLGALVVLVGIVWLGYSASHISVVTLVLLLGWMSAASRAQRQYVDSLRSSIYGHRIEAERLATVVMDRSTADVLADALQSNKESDILYALKLLDVQDGTVARERVRALVDHPSAIIRRRAISVLASEKDLAVLPQVERRLNDEDVGVRSEALLYLTSVTGVDPLERLDDLEKAHGTSLGTAMAFYLARPGPSQSMEAARLLLNVAIDRAGADGERARFETAMLLDSLPIEFDDLVQRLVSDPSVDVARVAIRAAGRRGSPAAAPDIVSRLADAALAADATEALAAMGDRAVPALTEALGAESLLPDVRGMVADILQRIGSASAEEALVDHLVDQDPEVRLRVVSALNKLRQLNPTRALENEEVETMLAAEIFGHYQSYKILGQHLADGRRETQAIDDLQTAMNSELERIFRLLKLLLPDNDFHSAYFGLQSANAVVRANALEFLEHTLPPQVRSVLLPLIDNEVSVEERISLADRMVGVPLVK